MGLSIGLISNTGMTPGHPVRTYVDQKGRRSYCEALTFPDEAKVSNPPAEIAMIPPKRYGPKGRPTPPNRGKGGKKRRRRSKSLWVEDGLDNRFLRE